MKDAILLFKFLAENSDKDYYVDVVGFLVTLGYEDFYEQKAFLNRLKNNDYIIEKISPLSPYYADIHTLSRHPNMEYKLMVKMTHKAEEYHEEQEEKRQKEHLNKQNLRISQFNLAGTLFAGLVAFISVAINTFQYYENKEKDVKLMQQEHLIKQLQSKKNQQDSLFLDKNIGL